MTFPSYSAPVSSCILEIILLKSRVNGFLKRNIQEFIFQCTVEYSQNQLSLIPFWSIFTAITVSTKSPPPPTEWRRKSADGCRKTFSLRILHSCMNKKVIMNIISPLLKIRFLKTFWRGVGRQKHTRYSPTWSWSLDEPYSAKLAQWNSHTAYRPARLHRTDTVPACVDWRACTATPLTGVSLL